MPEPGWTVPPANGHTAATMRFRSPRERRLWFFAAGYVLLIYSTLHIVRPITTWLRKQGLLRALIVAAFVVTLVVLLTYLMRAGIRWREGLVLAAAALGYAAVFPLALAPEERIHLLEYGLLGALLYLALLERRSVQGASQGSPGLLERFPGIAAFLIASAAGWVDEIIQGILPSRYYDLRDVGFNSFAAALAIAAMAARTWARARAAR